MTDPLTVGTIILFAIIGLLIALWPKYDLDIQIKEMQTDGRTSQEKADIAAMEKGVCPDCGESSLLAGPSGGMSQNVACNGCLHEFNVHKGFQGILGVDRSGRMTKERAHVFGISAEEYESIVS